MRSWLPGLILLFLSIAAAGDETKLQSVTYTVNGSDLDSALERLGSAMEDVSGFEGAGPQASGADVIRWSYERRWEGEEARVVQEPFADGQPRLGDRRTIEWRLDGVRHEETQRYQPNDAGQGVWVTSKYTWSRVEDSS